MQIIRLSMRRLRFGLLVSILGLVGPFASYQAQAQDYPNKPIRFVVSSAAGGVVDIRARRFGQRIGELLKQPIVVENRPGATTTIGAEPSPVPARPPLRYCRQKVRYSHRLRI